MEYMFEETNENNIQHLRMHLKNVPTLQGKVLALEDFFYSEVREGLWFVQQIDEVLKGKRETLESGGDVFEYVLRKGTSEFEYIFKNKLGNFTISTEVLREIAIVWNEKLTEFNKKHAKKPFWKRR